MEEVAEEFGAKAETIVFLDHFRELPDPRQRGKVIYPLDEILLLCLLAVLAGAETFVDIALFGRMKLEFLRRFRPFRDGTPSHDHLGDIFATLDAEQFQQCFVAWVAALTGAPAGVIAIDGKTSRRSDQKKNAKAPIHMVSAFAARQRLVLGQVKVAEKSNEIVAIPKLLDMLAIEGAIVTIDAMGCQRDIAAENHRQEGRLHPRAERQSRLAARGCRGVRRRTESQWLQGHDDQPARDGRWRSRPHRNPNHHRHPRCRLAAGAPRLARVAKHRHGREHARNRRQDRAGDALLHHVIVVAGESFLGRSSATIGRSRTACIGSWTWSSATTNAGSAPIMRPPTSPPSSTWPTT